MNIQQMIEQEIEAGYGDTNAQAKVCQDIVLKAISLSSLNRNVTIKGGVVMRSKTKNVRRATQDLDIDFIKYSLANESINMFVDKLNCIEGIKIFRVGDIEKLNQQDYHGKRVFIVIEDEHGNRIKNKLDLGVHNRLNIEQEEYCFDIAFDEEGASLLINSNEQMIVEKLRSLLRFGPVSTRYKDVFDIYFLSQNVDFEKMQTCLLTYIYEDTGIREKDAEGIIRRVRMAFQNKMYYARINDTKVKWLDEDTDTVLSGIIQFLEKLK